MYSQRDLTRLTAYKAVLRRRIVLRRAQCAAAATEALRPLALLDRLLILGRRLAPLAVPLGRLVVRRVFHRQRCIGTLAR